MKYGKLIMCAMAAAMLTACSGEGSVAGSGSPSGSPSSSGAAAEPTSVKAPRPPVFEDFPGESLLFVESGTNLGVKAKVIDSTWAPEVMGQSADPGHHWLAVWVAVTPELPDRGTDHVRLHDQLQLRYEPTAGTCGGREGSGHCFTEGWLSSALVLLEDAEWRAYPWDQQRYTSTDIGRGETRVGVVAFLVEDTVETAGFDLCMPSKEYAVDYERFPCLPIKTPDGAR